MAAIRYFKIDSLIVLLLTFSTLSTEAANPVEVTSGVRYVQIAQVNGEVFHQPGNSTEEQAAQINYPFLEGDRLISGSDGSAEILCDDGSIGWVWQDTKLDLTKLGFLSETSGQITAFRLWVGEAYFRFRKSASQDTSRMLYMNDSTLIIHETSLVRLHLEPDGEAAIYVYDGEIEMQTPKGNYSVPAGQAMKYDPSAESWESQELNVEKDEFDQWVSQCDQFMADGNSSSEYFPDEMRNSSPEMDSAGKWIYNIHLNGWCWVPYVSLSWVPYHYGFWDWIPGWGWTWIPYEPWGWIPYHYGYWAYYFEFGWMWVPHWHWGPHWAAWQWHGRSVHWVPLHPEDDFDASGRLISDSVPKNSLLKIGIPVEAKLDIKELPASIGSIESMQADPVLQNTGWKNSPPTFLENPEARPILNKSIQRRSSVPNRKSLGSPSSPRKMVQPRPGVPRDLNPFPNQGRPSEIRPKHGIQRRGNQNGTKRDSPQDIQNQNREEHRIPRQEAPPVVPKPEIDKHTGNSFFYGLGLIVKTVAKTGKKIKIDRVAAKGNKILSR
jgi:hypothetical protein